MAKRTNLDDIELFHEKGIHVPSRTLILNLDSSSGDGGVEIGPESASQLLANLHALTAISKDPIKILLNCPGGSVVDGMAIYDAIACNPCHITIEVFGQAASMGLIILQAADHRVGAPWSRYLAHDGEDGYAGHARDFEVNAAEGRVYRLAAYDILSKRTGKPKNYWARKMARDYYMSAQQALTENLIDEIINAQEF